MDILHSKKALALFIIHLSKEYSLECFLSYHAIIHYQKTFNANMNYKQSIIEAKKIYETYIAEESTFEVNIGWELRKEFIEIFAKNKTASISEILNLFELIKQEMIQLMEISLMRFQKEPQYEELKLLL